MKKKGFFFGTPSSLSVSASLSLSLPWFEN